MDNERYWVLDSPNPSNRINEISEAAGFPCVALVDEVYGGCIAYGVEEALEEIVARLNGGQVCGAWLGHGPGHQSRTRCRIRGPHEVHEAIYGSDQQLARWRNGSYTNKLREQGIEFDPAAYPEDMAMTGFFDEPPREEDDE
jgi:hypothetical protein